MEKLFKQSLLCFTVLGQLLNSSPYTWSGFSSNTYWGNSSNWTPNGIPNSNVDTATFVSGPNVNISLATLPSGTVFSPTVNQLNFNSGNYTISGIGLGGVLSLDGTTPLINVLTGTQVIDAILNINTSTNMTVNGDLNFTNNSQMTSLPGQQLTIQGTGSLNNNSPKFSPDTLQSSVLFNNYNQVIVVNATFLGTFNNLINATFSASNNVSLNGIINNSTGSTLIFSNLTATNSTINNEGTFELSSNTIQATNSTINNTNGGTFASLNITLTNSQLFNDSTSQLGPANFNINDSIVTNNGIEIGNFAMNSNSQVFGTGTFTNITNSGIVVPGSTTTPGTLTFTNYFNQNSPDGLLKLNILSDSAYGSIQANTASVNGVVNINFLPGSNLQGPEVLTLINTTSGLSVPGSVTFTNVPAIYDPILTVTDTSLLLTFDQRFNSKVNTFLSLKELIFSNINQLNLLISHRMDPCLYCCDRNAYIAPLGSFGTVHSKENTRGYHFNTVGFITGIDTYFCNTIMGAAIDYQRLHGTVLRNWGHFDIDQVRGSFYTSYAPCSHFYLDLILGGGCNWNEIHRRTGADLIFDNEAKPYSSTFDTLVGAKYLFTHDNFQNLASNFSFLPFVNFQYIYFDIDRVKERGESSFFNLSYESQKYESIRSTLGFKLNGVYETCGIWLEPEINLAWQKEYNSQNRRFLVTTNSLSGQTQIASNPAYGRDILLAGLDLIVKINDCYTFDAGYEFEGNSRYLNHFFYLEFNAGF